MVGFTGKENKMTIDNLKNIITAISSYCGFESEMPDKTTYLKDDEGKLHYRFYYSDLYMPDDSMNIFDDDTLTKETSIGTEVDDLDDANIYKIKNLIDDVEEIEINTKDMYIDIVPVDQTIHVAKGESTVSRARDGLVLLVEDSRKLPALKTFAEMINKNKILFVEGDDLENDDLENNDPPGENTSNNDNNQKDEEEPQGDDKPEPPKNLAIIITDIRFPHTQCHEALKKAVESLKNDELFNKAAESSFYVGLVDYSTVDKKAQVCSSNLRVCQDPKYGDSLFTKAHFWEGIGLDGKITGKNVVLVTESTMKQLISENLTPGGIVRIAMTSSTRTLIGDSIYNSLVNNEVTDKKKEESRLREEKNEVPENPENEVPEEEGEETTKTEPKASDDNNWNDLAGTGLEDAEEKCRNDAALLHSEISKLYKKYMEDFVKLQGTKVGTTIKDNSNKGQSLIAKTAGALAGQVAATVRNLKKPVQGKMPELPLKDMKRNSIIDIILGQVYMMNDSPSQFDADNKAIKDNKQMDLISTSHANVNSMENAGKSIEDEGRGVATFKSRPQSQDNTKHNGNKSAQSFINWCWTMSGGSEFLGIEGLKKLRNSIVKDKAFEKERITVSEDGREIDRQKSLTVAGRLYEKSSKKLRELFQNAGVFGLDKADYETDGKVELPEVKEDDGQEEASNDQNQNATTQNANATPNNGQQAPTQAGTPAGTPPANAGTPTAEAHIRKGKHMSEDAFIDAIYDEGYNAFYSGKKIEDNPYGYSVYRQDWNQGWKDAENEYAEQQQAEEYERQQAFDNLADQYYDTERGDWIV